MMGLFIAGFTVALSGLVAWSGWASFVPWKRDCGLIGAVAGVCGIVPRPAAEGTVHEGSCPD